MAARMIFTVSLLVAALSNVAFAAPLSTSHTLDSRCDGGITVIAARGTFQDPGVGSLSGITDLISKYAPESKILAVDYPATMENPAYMASVKIGTLNLQQMIISAVTECPSVKIALLGYSQGANVVGDALAGSTEDGNGVSALAEQYADNVKAVVLLGDPTHYGSQSFVYGGGNNNGVVPRVNGFEMAPYTNRIVSFCSPGDPYCDSGKDMAAHTSYMVNYAINAAWFTLANLWHS